MNRDTQRVQQSMTEGPMYEFNEVYDEQWTEEKAVTAKLGADKVKQCDVGCHEESSDTGTEEVNSEVEVAKDNHKVMEDSSGTEEKTIRRRNEKRNSDVLTVMAARR